MIKYLKQYLGYWIWFMKESYSFMAPKSKIWITITGLTKAHGFAKDMCTFNKLTPVQREAWYASGEDRLWADL